MELCQSLGARNKSQSRGYNLKIITTLSMKLIDKWMIWTNSSSMERMVKTKTVIIFSTILINHLWLLLLLAVRFMLVELNFVCFFSFTSIHSWIKVWFILSEYLSFSIIFKNQLELAKRDGCLWIEDDTAHRLCTWTGLFCW